MSIFKQYYIPYELLYIYSGGATGVHGGTYSTHILYPQTPRLRQKKCVLLSPINIVLTVISKFIKVLENCYWTKSHCPKGTADSFLRTSHVSRTRRAHQVKAAALSTLQRPQWAYDHYLSSVTNAMRSWNLMIGASRKQRRFSNSTTGHPSCNWS